MERKKSVPAFIRNTYEMLEVYLSRNSEKNSKILYLGMKEKMVLLLKNWIFLQIKSCHSTSNIKNIPPLYDK